MNSVNQEYFKTIIARFNTNNLPQYLRQFAPLEYFPKGHPIDYTSLGYLDDIRRYISESHKNPLILINEITDYYKLAWIFFCISLKFLQNNRISIGYAYLAYICANRAIYNFPGHEETTKFVRLRISGYMENDFYDIFQEMHNNDEISLLADDALAMAIISDVYSTKDIINNEKWISELRTSVREHESDYDYMTKEDIIRVGNMVHKSLNSHLVNKRIKYMTKI